MEFPKNMYYYISNEFKDILAKSVSIYEWLRMITERFFSWHYVDPYKKFTQ